MKQILISGYYGYNNAGDEAILHALCQLFSHDQVQISVLASDDLYTHIHPPLQVVPRMDPLAILRALKSCDLFISGGGGLFQDVTGFGSIPYYGGLLYMAKKMGIPTLIFGQGIGPIRHQANRHLFKFLTGGVDHLAVRDPESVSFLTQLGFQPERLSLMADPVLTLDPTPQETIKEYLTQEGLNPNIPMIGIAIRPWDEWFEKQLKSFSSVLAQFAIQKQAQLLLIPFQPKTDTWLCETAAYSMYTRPPEHCPPIHVLSGQYTPTDMMGIIGMTQLMVGMRLHSLIMAARMQIPSVGLVYDPKVRLFSESVDFPFIESITQLNDADQFYAALENTWQNKEEISTHLSKTLPLLQNRVYDSVRVALKLLKI